MPVTPRELAPAPPEHLHCPLYIVYIQIMKINKEQPTKKKSGMGMPLGMRMALTAILVALVARMGINAEELFYKKIVETFSEMIDTDEFHHAGIDINGDGFADLFLTVPYTNQSPFLRRLAGFLREGATVSFDDETKTFSRSEGIYRIQPRALLEINGRSLY